MRFCLWLLILASSGCSNAQTQMPAYVQPVLETEPVPSAGDAADDPAIWIHPDKPELSLIVATDKQSGLLTYSLAGKEREHVPAGQLNNVDLRQNPWSDKTTTLVAATQRDPARLVLFSLSSATRRLKLMERHQIPLADPYGLCLYQNEGGTPFVIVNGKDGRFLQYQVDADYSIELVRRWATLTQPEGCVADDDNAMLYLGEEDRGIWKLDADPTLPPKLQLLDSVDKNFLVADVEGLALYAGETDYLVASSQGNHQFAVYRLPEGERLMSFSVSGTGEVDGVSDTDGVALTSVSLPGFHAGLLVVQDGENSHPIANQNFKYLSWSDVARILPAPE